MSAPEQRGSLGAGLSRARVVVLAGPSGAGKSRLAARLQSIHGWPVVRLDDFYREGDDPALPVADLAGGPPIVDWDDPASWDAPAAMHALDDLVTTGAARVPVYDIGRSAVSGVRTLTLSSSQLVVAEGIFAAEIIERLRAVGLLHSAWCVRHNRWVTFSRRLVRDLIERRKPPTVLVRRGLALCLTEPQLVERMKELGATCASPSRVERALAAPRRARSVPSE
ncbi:ATP-binding protein [Lapillicoccus sp.]|uniref:uridine kinase family protein n=1 Tax=Lapillicoccus sp. TaxID=1909287 RepID=UPI0032630C13